VVSGGEPPEELWLAWHAKRWGYTPTEVLEQPAGLLTRMAVAWDSWERTQRALTEFQRVPTAGKAEWLKANPDAAAIWAEHSGIKEQMRAWRKKKSSVTS
jgi:hypothetical protein